MLLKVSSLDGVVILSAEGDLDSEAMAQLQNQFLDLRLKRRSRLVFDFSAVRHINYRCLGLLVEESIDLRAEGGDMKLTSLTPFVREIFRVTGAERAFDIYGTVPKAMAEGFGVEVAVETVAGASPAMVNP
jgi:anti-sigma B factor antagonist